MNNRRVVTALLPLRNCTDSPELRYALRSWEKYLLMDLNLVVVGDQIPSWLKPDDMIPGNRWANGPMNVYHNIMEGCAALAKEEEIIVMNDDFFVLDPVRDIVPTYRSTLAEHVAKARGAQWWTSSLRSTLEYIDATDKVSVPLSFELHRPCLVKPKFMELILRRAADHSPENPPQWRTLYGNLCSHWEGAAQARDAKTLRASQIPIGVPYVSTDDNKWRQYWGRVISPLFTEPSRWEAS